MSVLRMVWHRMAVSVPLLLTVSVIVFALQWLTPGDAAVSLAGPGADPSQIDELRRRLGLDKPIYTQYWDWLTNLLLHGSFGQSLINGESVGSILNTRLPVTLSLIMFATAVSTVIGLGLGVSSSRGSKISARVVDVASVAGLAVPSFWLGLLLIAVFSVSLGWLPPNGYTTISDSLSGWALSLALPVCALSAAGVTMVAKQVRDAMLDVLGSNFIRNLRANGLPERSVILKHALRSVAIPILTVSGLLFVNALGGAVVIEHVFGLPGLGSLAVTASSSHDIPIIQGVAMYFTLLVVAMNLLLDVTYGWINPRVRAT